LTGARSLKSAIAKRIVLELRERPSFEGELNVRVTEEHDPEGGVKYALVCQKNPPLSEVESVLFDGSLRDIAERELTQIKTGLCWQRELSSSEAWEITYLLQHEVVSIAPEAIDGLDGTSYELLIGAGLNRVQFSWWEEAPSGWEPLRDLSKMLLHMGDAARMAETLQSSERRQIIKHLSERLLEEQHLEDEAKRKLVSENNSRGRELVGRAKITGITCPSCKQRSLDTRFIERGADAKSFFICGSCGRSFFPEEVETDSNPQSGPSV
jgi:hypothetical protein